MRGFLLQAKDAAGMSRPRQRPAAFTSPYELFEKCERLFPTGIDCSACLWGLSTRFWQSYDKKGKSHNNFKEKPENTDETMIPAE